jgi:TfoX/Sxy family transcriptional regulator of competence genes
MAEPYLSELQSIVEHWCAPLEEAGRVSCKHFFAGVAAYADDRIFMTLTTVGLALKLPQDDRSALLGQGASPLRYFPNSPVKKDYVLLPKQIVDGAGLRRWILRSIEFVRT